MSEHGGVLLEKATNYQKEQQHTKEGRGFFFSGARGRWKGIRATKQALEDVFGRGKAKVLNSALFAESPARDRFESSGRDIQSSIEEGPTTVVAHSFGTAELCASIDEIKKNKPGFFQKKEHAENLHIKLISPAGIFKNRREGIKYLMKYGLLGPQEAGMLKRTLPGKTSILEGITSVRTLPPENISHKRLVTDVRYASRKLSQYDRSENMIDAESQRNYFDVIDPHKKTHIQKVDAKLKEAMDHGSEWQIRKMLRKRGRITRRPLQKVYRGDYSDIYKDPQIDAVGYEKDKVAKRKVRKLFKETFFKGKVLRDIQSLIAAGVDVEVIIPEQDILISKKDMQKLPGASVSFVPLSTHISPWAVQPEVIKQIALSSQKEFALAS